MKLEPVQKEIIGNVFGMGHGYVLDLSDKKMGAFFFEKFNISIYDKKYDYNYSSKSKSNRLKGILQYVDEPTAGQIILGLIDYKEASGKKFSEEETALINKAKQIGNKLITQVTNRGVERSIFKNLNHETADGVYTERIIRMICNTISEYFDRDAIEEVLSDLGIHESDLIFLSSWINRGLFGLLTSIKKGEIKLGQPLDERHISKIIESFLDPILWGNSSLHQTFYEKINWILSTTKLTLANYKGKYCYIYDESGWWTAQNAENEINFQELKEEELALNHINNYERTRYDEEIKSLKGKEVEIKELISWYENYMTTLKIFCGVVDQPTSDLNKSYLYLRDLVRKKVVALNLELLIQEPYIPFPGDLFSAEKYWLDTKKTILTWDLIRPELHAFRGKLDYLYQHSRTEIGDQTIEAVLPQILNIIEIHKKEALAEKHLPEYYITKEGDTFFYTGKKLKLKKSDNYVKAFSVLFEQVGPKGGFCSYADFEKAFKKSHFKLHNSKSDKFRIWAQGQLTDKSKGVLLKTHTDLIRTREGEGFEFNNKMT